MANWKRRRMLVGAALATALGMLGNPANALVVVGDFDPVNAFQGTYELHFDADCLNSNGWRQNIGVAFDPNDGICTMELVNASAVVNLTTPLYAGTLTFAPPVLSASTQVLGMLVVGNAYGNAFDTAKIPLITAAPGTDFEFWIQFGSGQLPSDFPPPLGVHLFTGIGEPNTAPLPGDEGTAQFKNFQVIPEPGTLALTLGALGGGWFARRRKKSRN